jgi:hypothetical protein
LQEISTFGTEVVSGGITLIADEIIQTLKERTHRYTEHGDLLSLHSFLKKEKRRANTDDVLVYSTEVGLEVNKLR